MGGGRTGARMSTGSSTLATSINEVLSRYIRIHDQITKSAIRRLLPIPGLFKAIPYCTYEDNLAALLGDLAAIRDRISDHLFSQKGVAPADEVEFIETLDEYAAALNDTIYRLHDIASELCRKSRGEGDYSLRRYQADMESYRASVDRYRRIGQRLNILHQRVRGQTG